MCVMALTLAGVQQANAQFFKKLGKVAGAILDAASKESESSNFQVHQVLQVIQKRFLMSTLKLQAANIGETMCS